MMRNPGGYFVSVGPDGNVTEYDSFTCGHCQKVIFVRPKCDPTELGGLCRQCMKMICPRCVEQGTCTPWEKQMEIAEAKDRALKSYEI